MLTLLLGRARSGKSGLIMNEIKNNVEQKRGGNFLLVPEQYSHSTARALSEFCGDSLSLYGEVVTFSLLADRVFAETGGLSETVMDEGGRLLVMSLAFTSVLPDLRVYGRAGAKSDFLKGILKASDELKGCCLNPDEMACGLPRGSLQDKLHDLALISGAFDAIIENSMQDPSTRIKKLAEQIGRSSIGSSGHFYIDGFSDFTALEMRVIASLLKKGSELTIALPSGEEDAFLIAEKTRRALIRLADIEGSECRTIQLTQACGVAAPELEYLEKKLFTLDKTPFEGESRAVRIIAAESRDSECEIAASELIRLVRDEGYRWRELSVTARGFENYEPIVENVFRSYGVPVFLNRKADILQKPVLCLITSALDAVVLDWDYGSVFRYLKTGLGGVLPEECDLLENYVLKWNIRGSRMWNREKAWDRCPRGYVSEMTDEDLETLREIDVVRRRAAAPLYRFGKAVKAAGTAEGHIMALYAFMEDLGLAGRLTEKTEQYRAAGLEKTAEEYAQLWDILVNALEQFEAILKDMPMNPDEFSRLLRLVLSSYSVATIPVTLDAVAAGDMTRMRSGDIKCLIVLGATDDALPSAQEGTGIITDSEREALLELGYELTGGTEDRILRESLTMYSSLTKPTERLVLTYPKNVGGVKKRPSYIISRAQTLLFVKTEDEAVLGEGYRTAAKAPCFELAVSGGETPYERAARDYFERIGKKEELSGIFNAAEAQRGALTHDSVESIYGRKLRLSASRIDSFYSCKFSYFLKYGLKAEPRRTAEFDAPELGTFLHYVLENVIGELSRSGSLHTAERQECLMLTERYVNQYVKDRLGGLDDKSGRFLYLFNRLVRDVYTIIGDMTEELRRSEFTPLSFELEFGSGSTPPALIRGGDMEISVGGVVDRVDGWLKGDKLYLRVVDYKTGKKAFDLSDIWYGLGMQMLIYLFTLEKRGAELFGHEIVPAGVLYAPARDVFLSMKRSSTESEIKAARSKSLMRSGLLINDSEVIEAMEKGEKLFLPVKFTKDGQLKPDSLATLEQLGKLGAHIEKTLRNIGTEMDKGNISADPITKPAESPCDYCDYATACHFDERTDRRRYFKRLKTDEIWNALEGGKS